MPTYDLGYRAWDGQHAPAWSRWLVIPATAVPLAWKSKWVRRLVVGAWIPALYFGVAFFLFEQYVDRFSQFEASGAALSLSEIPRWIESYGLDATVAEKVVTDPESVRADVWAFLLLKFVRVPQVWLLIFLVGLVAPDLVAQDIRTKAFLLYFARPITRFEYILGKGSVVGFYLGLIFAAPGLALYLFAIALSPTLGVVAETWHLPLRILAAYVVVAVPTSILALALSSLTSEGRLASFGWFAIWILGAAVSAATTGAGAGLRHASLYHCFGDLEAWVMGTHVHPGDLSASFGVVGVVTAVSLIVLYRRISAPMRV